MGRSIPISITSTTLSSFAVHLANMTKVLALILLGLVAIVLSEIAEGQSGEIDNIRSDNYLELNREIREADPGKKNRREEKMREEKRREKKRREEKIREEKRREEKRREEKRRDDKREEKREERAERAERAE